MTRRKQQEVLVGFELGTGLPVRVPLAHTFVTGQTQLSGKTTTLRAIVVRSGRRALAFVTKRGEEFEGRRIRPYLPREGDKPIHWRLVETILASALGQRAMKYERYWIVNAAKGARSLQQVRDNVDRLQKKAKGSTAETYELIGEYLDLVLPEMRELNAADQLDLQPGLSVIDLVGHTQQLQELVIRACLERINQHEREVLTVFPEAWKFAPRGRVTPSSAEAMAMAREGAVIGNLLMCDSQDIAGVDTVVRQAASVWILGVQRELNELKRTLGMIPAGIKKPKAQDITSLKLGQFVVCHGDQAIRTYAQPAWMDEADAIAIARGKLSLVDVAPSSRRVVVEDERAEATRQAPPAEPPPTPQLEDEDMSKEDVDRIEQQIGQLAGSMNEFMKTMAKHGATASAELLAGGKTLHKTSTAESNGSVDREELYNYIRGRLQEEAPKLLNVGSVVPELRVTEELKTIETSTTGKGSLMGRIALLIADGFFDEPKSSDAVREELKRYGLVAQKTYANVTYANNMSSLVDWGFLFVEGGNYQANPRMKKHVKRV
jgi:hypothetical protein